MCLRAANTSLEPRASNNYMSLTSRCEVQHRLEVRARRSREHFKGHPSIAYAGTLSHVVLTASTKLSLNIYSLNKNTVPELVHPKLYLNTVCITSCSLVAPDPYLRRHTMYTAPIYGSPKVYHRIKLKRVSPSISATPIPRISTLRPYLSSLYNPNAPSDRSLLQYLPFPPSLLMLLGRPGGNGVDKLLLNPSGYGAATSNYLNSARKDFPCRRQSPTGRIYSQGRSSHEAWRDLSDVCIMPVNIFRMQHAAPDPSGARMR
jgi:hypothetical protein